MVHRFSMAIGICVLLLMSCNNGNVQEENGQQSINESIALKKDELILWVNSYKVVCTRVAQQMCFLTQKGEKPAAGEWENFYGPILGLEWEPGQIYQLVVRKTELSPTEVPADASTLRYTVVQVLDQSFDPATRLHDIWVLESISGSKIEIPEGLERPTLEIKLSMQQIMGTDGCNQYKGEIQKVDSNTFVPGPLASTKKACPQMELPDQFHRQMEKIQRYSLEELTLVLKDDQGDPLMSFRKVD